MHCMSHETRQQRDLLMLCIQPTQIVHLTYKYSASDLQKVCIQPTVYKCATDLQQVGYIIFFQLSVYPIYSSSDQQQIEPAKKPRPCRSEVSQGGCNVGRMSNNRLNVTNKFQYQRRPSRRHATVMFGGTAVCFGVQEKK